eukprot:TRINITY_DN10523_c0_g1_i1.p1 TRINITY_DN10523_c0_g1~~TRINITY_DN10523_c0_g1_i1.p1  ORF type:complete len:589 (+),score=78.84 TRINITY_DN10523_c0_g1_i1:69-1769(+)
MSAAAPVFLVLGGTGSVGKYLLPEIVKHFASCKLLIATRSVGKAEIAVDKLNHALPGCAQPIELDIGSQASLDGVPPFTVLVNLLTTNRMLGKDGVSGTADMVRFAVSRDAHYVDADPDICLGDWRNTMEKFQKEIGPIVPAVLLGAGEMPGLLAPLIRATSARLTSCESVCVEVLAYPPPSISDDFVMMTEKAALPLEYRGGRWRQRISWRAVDFGSPYGSFAATSAFFPEMAPLPAEQGLTTCRLNVAQPGRGKPESKATCCLMCKCIPRSTRIGFAKRFLERAFAPLYEQYGNHSVFQCRASGTNAEGQECQVMLKFEGNRGCYHFTAMCVLATIEQIIDGSVKGNAPPEFAGLRVDADAAVRSVASKASVKFEETVSSGPPRPVPSEATAIARSKACSFFGAMSWLTKLLVFSFSFWAANAVQWQADATACKYVLWTLECYVCYYAVWIYFFTRIVICGSAWERQCVLVRYIDFIWFCSGYWLALYAAFATCPAMKHGSAVVIGAVVANTVDFLVLQARMYTDEEWNVAWSAMLGGVYAREPRDQPFYSPLLGESVEVQSVA